MNESVVNHCILNQDVMIAYVSMEYWNNSWVFHEILKCTLEYNLKEY